MGAVSKLGREGPDPRFPDPRLSFFFLRNVAMEVEETELVQLKRN
jgi:hypothetical protein